MKVYLGEVVCVCVGGGAVYFSFYATLTCLKDNPTPKKQWVWPSPVDHGGSTHMAYCSRLEESTNFDADTNGNGNIIYATEYVQVLECIAAYCYKHAYSA